MKTDLCVKKFQKDKKDCAESTIHVQETHTQKRIQFESLQDLFLSAFVRTHTGKEPVSTAKTMIWCKEFYKTMGEICRRQPKISGNVPETAENHAPNTLST